MLLSLPGLQVVRQPVMVVVAAKSVVGVFGLVGEFGVPHTFVPHLVFLCLRTLGLLVGATHCILFI